MVSITLGFVMDWLATVLSQPGFNAVHQSTLRHFVSVALVHFFCSNFVKYLWIFWWQRQWFELRQYVRTSSNSIFDSDFWTSIIWLSREAVHSATQGSMVQCTIQWIGKLATKVQWGRSNYPAKKVGQRYKWLRYIDISVPFLICSSRNLTKTLDWLLQSLFVLICVLA